MLENVVSLLKEELPALKGRIEGALQLAPLIQNNTLPQVTPAAFVIPAGINGGEEETITGIFRQHFSETLAVVIVMREADSPKSARTIDPLKELVWSVIKCLAGREMGDADGVLTLRRAFLVSMNRGAVVFQIEFTLKDQLRIDR